MDFSYQILAEDIHSRFAQKYIRPVLNGETEFAVYLAGDGEQWQQEVISLLQDIGVCPEHGLTDHELLVRSRIYAVWDQMTHHAAYTMREKSGKHSSERLAPVVEYMHQNYAYEITLAELAALLPMSEGQFCRAGDEAFANAVFNAISYFTKL